jgi:acetolactate synthase-1/2/3 large subunit
MAQASSTADTTATKQSEEEPESGPETLSGARIVVEALKKEGVEVVFGYPGGSIIPVFDELYDETAFRLVLPRHEQAGGHEAEGYAKSTGNVGVVITTGGPGATNLTTALADAHMDSVPLVAISGQVKTFLIGTDAFQEADMTGISYGITKHNYLVKDVRDLAQTIKEAFHLAATGRPGPVHISIPVDVQNAVTTFEYPEEIHMRNYKPTYKGHVAQIEKARTLIEHAERPIVLVGGGAIASGATEEVNELLKKTEMPAVSTLMGLGVVPTNTPLYAGMLGMHGTITANKAMGEADLIVNIGARFDDRVTGNTKTFAQHAQVIHIDIDPSSIGKNVETNLPIVGDAKQILTKLLPTVQKPDIDAWRTKVREMHEAHPIRYPQSDEGVSPEELFDAINKVAAEQVPIYATEVGQHQMWAAQLLELHKPRQLITSGGLGTMGFGLPASIGAQLGNPKRTVVCLAGDGSIQMNIQELALLHTYNIPVKVIVINNGYLGMVRQWQEMFHDKRYSATCLTRNSTCPVTCTGKSCRKYTPDFMKLADAYHIPGYRATTTEELDKALTDAFVTHKESPALIEVWIPREEKVMPMVPPGGSLSDVIDRDN